MMISKFQIWVLRYIFKRIVRQGWFHTTNIEKVFKLVMEATKEEFTEDSGRSLYAFLREQFDYAAFEVLVGDMTVEEFSNLKSW